MIGIQCYDNLRSCMYNVHTVLYYLRTKLIFVLYLIKQTHVVLTKCRLGNVSRIRRAWEFRHPTCYNATLLAVRC